MDLKHTHEYNNGTQSIGLKWYLQGGSTRLLICIKDGLCDSTLSLPITPDQLLDLVNRSIHPPMKEA